MKKILCFLISLQISLIAPAMAQEGTEDDIIKNTQNDILVVAGAGVGGAILGLSTLSFVDKPSEHVGNIWTGAAIGVIVGVIFVAYYSAQKGSEELVGQKANSDFETSDRSQWHSRNDRILSSQSVQYGTQLWQTSF